MSDYSQYNGYVNEEWLAASTSGPPLDPPSFEQPAARRKWFNELVEGASAAAMVKLASKIRIQNFTFTARDGTVLGARSYRPVAAGDDRLPVFFYLHGGGYLLGSLDVDDATCTEFALKSNVVVFHADYRHTPDFTYPTQWNDSEDAFVWFHNHIDDIGGIPESVVVGGISAGAQLSASLVLRQSTGAVASGTPPIAGQLLMVPPLSHVDTRLAQLKASGKLDSSSYEANKNTVILSLDSWRLQLGLLKIGEPDPRDLRLNSINATLEEVKRLPPTTVAVCGLDILRDEGLEYAKKLSDAGVPVDVHIFKGMPHFFRGFGDKLSACKRWDEVIDSGIKWPLTGPSRTEFFIKEN